MKITGLLLIILSVPAFPQVTDSFIDTRDAHVYETITLGSQTWMSENLAWELTGSWCYADSSANCDVYGRLYTWEQATRACPAGWRLPGDDDWKVLERYMGMTAEEADIFLYRGKNEGTKLKSELQWPRPGGRMSGDESGFDALPGGFRHWSGEYHEKGKRASWWTSTMDEMYPGKYAYRRAIYHDREGIDRDAATLTLGFSVRCIKNEK